MAATSQAQSVQPGVERIPDRTRRWRRGPGATELARTRPPCGRGGLEPPCPEGHTDLNYRQVVSGDGPEGPKPPSEQGVCTSTDSSMTRPCPPIPPRSLSRRCHGTGLRYTDLYRAAAYVTADTSGRATLWCRASISAEATRARVHVRRGSGCRRRSTQPTRTVSRNGRHSVGRAGPALLDCHTPLVS